MYKIKSNLKLFFFNIHAIYDKLIKMKGQFFYFIYVSKTNI